MKAYGCLVAIAPDLRVSHLPIRIPDYGVRQASMVLALGVVGVSEATALLTSLGIGVTVLVVSLLGAVGWAASGPRGMFRSEACNHELEASWTSHQAP